MWRNRSRSCNDAQRDDFVERAWKRTWPDRFLIDWPAYLRPVWRRVRQQIIAGDRSSKFDAYTHENLPNSLAAHEPRMIDRSIRGYRAKYRAPRSRGRRIPRHPTRLSRRSRSTMTSEKYFEINGLLLVRRFIRNFRFTALLAGKLRKDFGKFEIRYFWDMRFTTDSLGNWEKILGNLRLGICKIWDLLFSLEYWEKILGNFWGSKFLKFGIYHGIYWKIEKKFWEIWNSTFLRFEIYCGKLRKDSGKLETRNL